ncbi:4-hydroxy-tetrahydrodipicolinate synthase [Clostridium grantii]|uniref:4-hydroxy-tetrahydrodipicolinate synthase n=1 Tax=Clostridium grantii DSM 8605 TaxID=1121316 RepID=A0A1M5Y0M1_9CLOT|nr:4-hydroxy-tetrahydrodipicolinate synthase [Clostridium grantii]SHI05611.1 4-hydroxy-tetrahydrodipicolinate synthase [Clostridium grantii DSM 8605]
MSLFKGSGVAIVTPFKDGKIDFKKLEELLEWHISSGTDAIIICGTTGEASTMSLQEKKEAIKFTVDIVNKRIPVIAGTGSNNTSDSKKFSIWAESIGADGLLLITPYYNKTTQKGLVLHYKEICDAVSIPAIVYNVPSRTSMNIEPKTLLELSKIENIVAIKEASGNIAQVARMMHLCGDKIDLYSGNDDQIVPLLSLGGSGVISVAANILPTVFHDICSLYFEGKTEESAKLQLKYISLLDALFIETNPIPVKTAMNLMGLDAGELRLPLCEMCEENKNKLVAELKAANIIIKEI